MVTVSTTRKKKPGKNYPLDFFEVGSILDAVVDGREPHNLALYGEKAILRT